jgi:hypothetical protein
MLHRSSSRWGTRDLEGLAACHATDASARLNVGRPDLDRPADARSRSASRHRRPTPCVTEAYIPEEIRGGMRENNVARDYFAPDFEAMARKWNFETFAWPSVNMTSVITR